MVRYQDDDSDSGRALLIGAGVVSGLLAGAVVAHRLGGLKGIRRALSRRRFPLLGVLRAAIPSKTLTALLDAIGIDEILAGLVRESGRRPSRLRQRRRPDPDLDEYEVEDFERAAAGLDDDDDDEETTDRADDLDDEFDEDEEEDAYEEDADEDEEAYEEDADEDEEAGERKRVRGRAVFEADLDDDPSELDEEEDEEDDDEEELGEAEVIDTFTPEALEDAVLAAFRRHPVLRQRALEIAVDEDGVAELTGWVRRERDVRIARRVASAVPGIERVIVDVAVRDVTVRDVARVVSDVQTNGA